MAGRYVCPVCGAEKNKNGNAFRSYWALASHVAGKIRASDKVHRKWAQAHVENEDLKQGQNALAQELKHAVRYEAINEERNRCNKEIENLQRDIQMLQIRMEYEDAPRFYLEQFEEWLHSYIENKLEIEFGVEREAWWVKGVPEQIRGDCAQRREREPGRHDLYAQTYLIDLKTIMDKNWRIFDSDFRKTFNASSKKDIIDLIAKANNVRNLYYHAPKAPKKGTEEYEEDRDFCRRLMAVIDTIYIKECESADNESGSALVHATESGGFCEVARLGRR